MDYYNFVFFDYQPFKRTFWSTIQLQHFNDKGKNSFLHSITNPNFAVAIVDTWLEYKL